CIAALYLEKLPGITIQVLETGERAALDRDALPQYCGYEFLQDVRPFDQAAAFEAGLRRFNERKEYFLFIDSGVLIDLIDLKPNLLMLKQHDFVTCFERMILLDEADTLRIINNDFRWDYGDKYRLESSPHLCSSACMFTRRGIEAVGGWSAGEIGD